MKGLNLRDNIAEVSKACPAAFMSNDTNSDDGVKEIFLNPAQLLIHNFGAREMYICGARGVGKTTIMSSRLDQCQISIPRGAGTFMGSSLKQLYCKTMPQLIKSLEQLRGYVEGRDFVRGRPDRKLQWEKPLAVPRIWENVIAFPNGNVCYLISTGVAAAANGMNLCYSLSDETRFLDWNVYVESIRPALRGDVYPGGHPGWSKTRNPFYLSQFFVSDAGIINKQTEWEKEELTQTDDVNDCICEMLAEIKYAEQYDKINHTNVAWRLAHNEKFTEKLQYLRTQSKVFMRFSSIHNISVLGEDYIKARKRDMPSLLFERQILGLKAEKDKSQLFYPNFNPDVHLYSVSEKDETEIIYNKFQSKHHFVSDLGGFTKKFDYEAPDLEALGKVGDNCAIDVDINPSAPLCIAHDFNKNVNTIITAQADKVNGSPVARVLSSMYVVAPKMLEDLMENWCKYYALHKAACPLVYLYYDATAKQGGTYASRDAEKYKFYNIIASILKNHGWVVKLVFLGSPMSHGVKFEFLNAVFAGKERMFVLINRERNDYLIASLESAKTTTKFGRIHKDKSNEKKRSGAGLSANDELGTNNLSDMSDAFDTIIRGMVLKPNGLVSNSWDRVTTSAYKPIVV